MTAKLTIVLDDEVIDALRKAKSITITLGSAGRARSPDPAATPRAGSLPARILAWAEKRRKPFRTGDIVKRFKVSGAHASMLLGKLAKGPYPVRRKSRGVYESAD